MGVSPHRRRRPGAVPRGFVEPPLPGSPPPGPRRPARSRLRVRDWRVPTKLIAVLLVPSLAFLALAGIQVSALASEAKTLNEFERQVRLAVPITALAHEVQDERDRTLVGLGALQPLPEQQRDTGRLANLLTEQYTDVDKALADLRTGVADVKPDTVAWRDAWALATERLGQLAAVRDAVRTDAMGALGAYDFYGLVNDALLGLLGTPTPGSGHTDLIEAQSGLIAVGRTKELASRLRGRVAAVTAAGRYAPGDYVDIADLRGQYVQALVSFRASAPAGQVFAYDDVVRGGAVYDTGRLAQAIVDSTGRGTVAVDSDEWWSVSTTQQDLARQVEQRLVGQVVGVAGARSADQTRRTILASTIIVGILLLALLTSVAIGRSMAASLRRLRRQALRVADGELPELLQRLRSVRAEVPEVTVGESPVRSGDEIGEVAEAFTAVHRSAVHLAVEQATMRRNVNAMFVNLARRSQVLVERQLELLDELERDEGDPDQLHSLFRLDHLAARMRRNDENLLVLAGSEAARRWSAPVSLPSAILAAMGEIEQYPRVRHDIADHLHVAGHAVADLVHLLAELLENATAFSPPSTVVLITGHQTRTGGAFIEIADEGLGMTERALAEANEVLAAPPAADVSASERMGLFVVSHIAARHGATVRLRSAEPGVIAMVELPPALISLESREVGDRTGVRPGISALTAPAQLAPSTAAPAVPGGLSRLPVGRPGRRGMAAANGDDPNARSAWWARSGRSGAGARGNGFTSAAAAAPSGYGPPQAGYGTTGGPRPGIRPPVSGAPISGVPISPVAGGFTAPGAGFGGAGGAAPPAVPVTGGTGPTGLPLRVPMAQLPHETGAGPRAPATREDPDPMAIGGVLSRFYGGVRRAEAEDEGSSGPARWRGAGSEED